MTLPTVETDGRSRVVLPGHALQRFVVQENADGSILLQPAKVVTEAQLEYDESPALRELLSRAAASPTVRRTRPAAWGERGSGPGDGDDHGDEVVIDCSAVADEQLDEIENSDSDLYNDILTVCELVMTSPDRAQSMSTASRPMRAFGCVWRCRVATRTRCSGAPRVRASRRCSRIRDAVAPTARVPALTTFTLFAGCVAHAAPS